MGLFVVARLAARHGIRVRLRPAPAGGLTALVWLPDEVVSNETVAGTPGLRRFDAPALSADAADAASAGRGTRLNLVANGNAGGVASPAEQEINAARAPKFASQLEPADDAGGLGPHRVPGAGLHPGNAGWGGPATTSPLPAVGSDAAEADLTAQAERTEALSGPYASPGLIGGGATPVAGVAEQPVAYSAAPAPSVELGQPIVVGHPDGSERADDSGRAERSFSWERGQDGNGAQVARGGDPLGTAASASGVVVPPADRIATENRLPIFEAVESDWFRRGRSGVATVHGVGAVSGQPAPSFGSSSGSGWPSPAAGAPEPEVTWTASAADRGWEAAAAVSSPTTGGTTTAGLPKRVPQANLVPGAAAPEPMAPGPARSAAATRDKFASFQRGAREGRAAVAGEDAHADGDDGYR
ncbi:MAG TPA: hypothetical protein VLM11_00715 [Streptosporangiaceae bacterium]|nr:hypothetical protein [Streptosporangiaceae bacterium]